MASAHDDSEVARIDVCGARYDLTAGEPVLRGLARLVGRALAEGNYCWTGECGHCEVAYELADGRRRTAMSCLLAATDGLRVTGLSPYLWLDLAR